MLQNKMLLTENSIWRKKNRYAEALIKEEKLKKTGKWINTPTILVGIVYNASNRSTYILWFLKRVPFGASAK